MCCGALHEVSAPLSHGDSGTVTSPGETLQPTPASGWRPKLVSTAPSMSPLDSRTKAVSYHMLLYDMTLSLFALRCDELTKGIGKFPSRKGIGRKWVRDESFLVEPRKLSVKELSESVREKRSIDLRPSHQFAQGEKLVSANTSTLHNEVARARTCLVMRRIVPTFPFAQPDRPNDLHFTVWNWERG